MRIGESGVLVSFGGSSLGALASHFYRDTQTVLSDQYQYKYSLFEYSLIPLALLISGRKFNLPKVAMGGIGSPHEYPIPEK